MFERFTDRARRVLVVAQDEARELGHRLIRPEHIGLGLLVSGGPADRALQDFGVTVDQTRERVVATIPVGESLAGEKLPFTPEAKKVLELSLREALRLKHNYIGTEHLLLGLLRNDEAFAFTIFGADAELLRTRVIQLVTVGMADRSSRSPALNTALGRAQAVAGDDPVGTADVLVAIARDQASQGGQALSRLGVTQEAISDALAQVPVDGTTDAPGPPQWFEIRLGGRTATVEDPELARALAGLDTSQIRALLRKGLDDQEAG